MSKKEAPVLGLLMSNTLPLAVFWMASTTICRPNIGRLHTTPRERI